MGFEYRFFVVLIAILVWIGEVMFIYTEPLSDVMAALLLILNMIVFVYLAGDGDDYDRVLLKILGVIDGQNKLIRDFVQGAHNMNEKIADILRLLQEAITR